MSIPSFHDGYFTGITLGEKTATLGLMTHDGFEYRLVLSGVRALQLDDVKAGNVILSLAVVTSCEPDPLYYSDWPERLFPAPHPSAERKYHDAHDAGLSAALAAIISGETSLVTINPAYGADFLALCESVRLHGPLRVA